MPTPASMPHPGSSLCGSGPGVRPGRPSVWDLGYFERNRPSEKDVPRPLRPTHLVAGTSCGRDSHPLAQQLELGQGRLRLTAGQGKNVEAALCGGAGQSAGDRESST